MNPASVTKDLAICRRRTYVPRKRQGSVREIAQIMRHAALRVAVVVAIHAAVMAAMAVVAMEELANFPILSSLSMTTAITTIRNC
jgi:hypothetical protein